VIEILLTREDEILCAQVGLQRVEYSKMRGMEHSYITPNNGNYFRDVLIASESAAAEMAVARSLGIMDFKPTANTFKAMADVAENIEVKWTSWTDGHLIVHPKDRDSDIAVLVVGDCPKFKVIGWIPMVIAKKPRFKHSKMDAWWISQINLQPIETLKRSSYAPIQI